MALLGDRVQETTSTAGTGTFALGGAVTGYVTFNSTFTNGDIVWYVCDDGAGNWEIGTGTVGTGTLTRTVFQSSNSNSLVSFSAGTKRIFCSAPYTYLLPNQTGNTGKVLTTDGSTPSWTTPATGTVTAVSVATANGLAGTSSGGATPQLTLSTSVTGVLKGNGTAISAASAGTDYAGITSANTFTDAQTISVSSASDALRITQTGAGNALVVEDSANPDSTPFVVDASGNVIIGKTTQFSGSISPKAELLGGIPADASLGLYNFNTTSSGAIIEFGQSNNATIGSQTVVASGDNLGAIRFSGSDGTNLIRGAQIVAQVDGTPGTNDMPGRLMFSTTADGASSPTERMRIDNAGRVGIGGTDSREMLNVGGHTSTATGIGYIRAGGTLPATATSYVIPFHCEVTTPASATTFAELSSFKSQPAATGANSVITSISGFVAIGPTLGAGSSITNQFGFQAASSLTGATNNYGFYSNIPSGTGRYNFYAAGTAANYFAGDVTIDGNTTVKNYTETTYSANSSTAITLSLANGTMQLITLTGSPTITMPTAAAGKSFTLILYTGSGSYTVSWSTVAWAGGTTPTVTTTASKKDIFNFYSDGTNWYGAIFGQSF